MQTIQTATGVAGAYPNPNPNTTAGELRRSPRPRDTYADAGRSARAALDALRDAEIAARSEGATVPPSCARVLLEIIGHLTTWSRRNDAMSVRRVEQGTGLSRSTVRRALRLLEGYGCIVRITPANVKGQRTGSTIIALPIVEPVEDHPAEDHADKPDPDAAMVAAYEHHQAEQMEAAEHAARYHLDDPGAVSPRRTPPGSPRRTRPPVHPDAPATRSNEKEVREVREKRAREDRPPDGRAGARPVSSPAGGDGGGHAAFIAAEKRMRDGIATGKGVDPADAALVARQAQMERATPVKPTSAQVVADDGFAW